MNAPALSLGAWITNAIQRLREAHIDNPQLDARLLAGHALSLDRAQLLSQSTRLLSPAEQTALETLIARREKHESVARIIGSREFWGLSFGLNEATLEPRPDSETLIEAVLKNVTAPPRRLLDLGTGTGCLLLSLLHEWPQATGLGIDLDPRAVEQATRNAAALNLSARADFQTGDWLNGIDETFDVIISNPPYIPAAAIATLMADVRDFDPRRALDGGEDGLAPYRYIIPQLKNRLNKGGLVAFEFGQGQDDAIAALLSAAGFTAQRRHQDLGGITRCITAQNTAL